MINLFGTPTAEQFRALARSSPWRWTTLEYERSRFGGTQQERGCLKRPDKLRVDFPDGQARLIEASLAGSSRTIRAGVSIGEPPPGLAEAVKPAPRVWPTQLAPVYDEDGLVLLRPASSLAHEIEYDPPFNGDYHWVAMLDPAELADSHDGGAAPPVELHDLRAVSHHGRPTWEARVCPTVRYSPRCDCCSLLTGCLDESDSCTWVAGGQSLVRLDTQTGICVYVEHFAGEYQIRSLNGETLVVDVDPGIDLDLRIIAVDQDMDEELFQGSANATA